MTDLVASFQKLVSGLSSSQSQESDLFLLQLEPATAQRVRLCAIPHTFNAAILQVLDATLSPSAAAEVMSAIQHFAAVVHLPGCLALHDVIRRQLFLQWLAPDRNEEFAAVSRRLAQHFRPQESDTAVDRAAKEYSFVFHLIGADFEEGFKHFRLLYQERREQLRTSECEILVRLLREYEPALPAPQRAWLSYYEAEIADDARDWPRATSLLNNLLAQNVRPDLRSMALLRLGSVLRQSGQFEAAEKACSEAIGLLEVLHGDGAPAHLIHYELGLIARDQGDVERARTCLDEAIRLAKVAGDQLYIVAASNSLGTLLLRISPREAVGIFEECLKLLNPERDGARIAQILNNLATAHANAGDWDQSEAYYQQSLNIKRTAADLRGQALTLFNIARVYQSQKKQTEARNALSEAAALFDSTRDPKYAARAYRELARVARSNDDVANTALHARKAIELFEQSGEAVEGKATYREFKSVVADPAQWSRRLAIIGVFVGVLILVLIAVIAFTSL